MPRGELGLEPIGLALEPQVTQISKSREEAREEGKGERKVGKRIREKEKLLTMALEFGDETKNKVKQ